MGERTTKYVALSYHRNVNRSTGRCLVNSTLDRCNRRKNSRRFYHRSNISVGLYARWARWFSEWRVASPHARTLRQKQAPLSRCVFGTAEWTTWQTVTTRGAFPFAFIVPKHGRPARGPSSGDERTGSNVAYLARDV